MIPERLRKARLAAGLTQEKLGLKAGIEEQTARGRISHYEKGHSAPNYKVACNMATVLNVPEAYFYTQDENFAEAILLLYKAYKRIN